MIGEDVPKIAAHMRITHVTQQGHVFVDLPLVFGTFGARLKVDDHHLLPIVNHTVGAFLHQGLCLVIVGENGALVKHLPVRIKPLAHFGRLQAVGYGTAQFGAGERLIVARRQTPIG